MSIFTCGICFKDYNDYTKKPLSLPCGHVFCEECISKMFLSDLMGMKCPSDNIVHKIEMSKIPICAQILAHLPKQHKKTNIVYCMRHPNKKIKYFCRTHSVFPCSICVVEHTDHDIACFESNQSAFISEIKTLHDQFNSNREHLLLNKSKNEHQEKSIIDHFNIQINNVDRYFDKLYSLLKEKKRSFINELNTALNETKKNNENKKKIYTKANERYIDLGNKMKHIDELFNKGEYEVFYTLKQKIINEIKTINATAIDINNTNEALPEFIAGQHGLVNSICGDIKIKVNKANNNQIPIPININLPNSLVKERDKEQFNNNEDTKSIDSMTTMMIISNDTNNVFKENLLKASENEISITYSNSNDASTIQTNSNYNNYNSNSNSNYKFPYQKFVSPIKQDQASVSSQMGNFNHNIPQTNRDTSLLTKPSQNNSEKKLLGIGNNYNTNFNSMSKNSQRNDGIQFNHQTHPKTNIMNTSNMSANKKDIYANEKNNNKIVNNTNSNSNSNNNYFNNNNLNNNINKPRLKTESSLEKSNSKTNNNNIIDKGDKVKYTPLVSSSGTNDTISKEDKANPKRQLSKKKQPNAFNAFCNVNSNINNNSNGNNNINSTNNNLFQNNKDKDNKQLGVNRKNSKNLN